MGGRLGRVGPYALQERLGRGGMGEVYLASRRGRQVALKMLREPIQGDEAARLRLDREVRALRRVESPYVARVLDADLAGDRPYLVMEHIKGENLLDAVRRGGPLKAPELIALAQGLATALAIIHAAGIVHRDLKPANVLLGEDNPVLVDFGIAQMLDATRLTLTGSFLGTPGYAAPELFADEVVAEPADVHAWAATVAFAATGRPTFGRGTAEAQMYAVLHGKADLKGVPAALLPLIRAALNREPAKRPTAAVLSDRLNRLAKAMAPPPPLAPGGWQPIRPRRSPSKDGSAADSWRGAHDGDDLERRPEERAQRRDLWDADAADDPELGGRGSRRSSRDAVSNDEHESGGRGARRSPRDAVSGDEHESGGRGARRSSWDAEPDEEAVPEASSSPLNASANLSRSEGHVAEAPPQARHGNQMLGVLAVLAVPAIVASAIWPLVGFAVTSLLVVLARALWSGEWLVRRRRSARTRGILRIAAFPMTFLGALVAGVAWPGLPAGAAAVGTIWALSGWRLENQFWLEAGPVSVAAVVFGVVCGGIIGREVERVGAQLPGLRREGLRALTVFGGFVALCAAAVRGIGMFF